MNIHKFLPTSSPNFEDSECFGAYFPNFQRDQAKSLQAMACYEGRGGEDSTGEVNIEHRQT